MKSHVDGAWTGWSGDTIVRLANGTVWRQVQYYYRYQYKYRPRMVSTCTSRECKKPFGCGASVDEG